MGGFDPVSTAVTVGAQVAQMQAQRKQAEAAADAQGQQMSQQSQLMWRQQDLQAKQQRNLMKRQLATARASLAGGGVGFAGGSGQALMDGLVRQTEGDIAESAEMARWRHQIQFPAEGRAKGQGLKNGLAVTQQSLSLLRPFFS